MTFPEAHDPSDGPLSGQDGQLRDTIMSVPTQPIDHAGLREIAEKAAHEAAGSWMFLDIGEVVIDEDEAARLLTLDAELEPDGADAVGEHIAAFDPPTVLRLLDEITSLKKSEHEYRELLVAECKRSTTAEAELAALRERLQAIIDWADLALSNPATFDSHGVRNLDGPVFDEARAALGSPDTVGSGGGK